jgi:antitoxin ParD1/3/4
MATMNISLPDTLKEFVEQQVAEGGYETMSEYVQELICAAQKRKAEETLEALMLEGLDSGEPIEVTQEYWEKKWADAVARQRLSQTLMPFGRT